MTDTLEAMLERAQRARERVGRISSGSRVIPNHMSPLVFDDVPALAADVIALVERVRELETQVQRREDALRVLTDAVVHAATAEAT